MIPYDNFDPEVVPLCKALNTLPGIETIESCCGHGEYPFRIWFKVDGRVDPRMTGLFFITRSVDRRYWQFGNEWDIKLSVGDSVSKGILPTLFLLESTALGEEAYAQARDLFDNMTHFLNHTNFKSYFKIDLFDFGELAELKNLDGHITYDFK